MANLTLEKMRSLDLLKHLKVYFVPTLKSYFDPSVLSRLKVKL
jgi:hypothetical protein